MAETLEHNEWSGKTDGRPWMQRALIGLFRVLPLWLLYGIMALVVPFYMLFNRKGYRAMFCFFHERLGSNRWKSFWQVYLNHFRFGQIVLDRFCVFAGKRFGLQAEGREAFDNNEASDQGFVILSSHVGNYEMAGYFMRPKRKKINALVYMGETETVMKNRRRLFSQNESWMVPMKEDFSHLFLLNAALDQGDIVSMPADRIFGSQKSVECQFLGQKARFPLGPFAMAVQKEVHVVTFFVMKEGWRSYRVFVREVCCDKQASKREQMAQMAQDYANQLEDIVRRYPSQWFNYFDFWKQ